MSELRYRFPNPQQYDHYTLLETEQNIFAAFHGVRRLHLRIMAPDGKDLVSNPSSSYLHTLRRHQQQLQQQQPTQAEADGDGEETAAAAADDGSDYLLLNSTAKREYAQRAPITRVETSIYSRSILAYLDAHLTCVDTLCLEFDAALFSAPLLTSNMAALLGRVGSLRLVKRNTGEAVYCGECVALLQYTRRLRSLTFNFPLSSAFYPVLNELASLKVMHRVEMEADLNVGKSAYAQNIATLNAHSTTLISNVKLQHSLLVYFCPWLRSLHVHGSKGLQSLATLFPASERISAAMRARHKVFLALEELCLHCSDAVCDFVEAPAGLSQVPQLKRLQLVLGAQCSVARLLRVLRHVDCNAVLNASYEAHDSLPLLGYYWKYYTAANVRNCARQLRHVHVVSKKTSHAQNYALLKGLAGFLGGAQGAALHAAAHPAAGAVPVLEHQRPDGRHPAAGQPQAGVRQRQHELPAAHAAQVQEQEQTTKRGRTRRLQADGQAHRQQLAQGHRGAVRAEEGGPPAAGGGVARPGGAREAAQAQREPRQVRRVQALLAGAGRALPQPQGRRRRSPALQGQDRTVAVDEHRQAR